MSKADKPKSGVNSWQFDDDFDLTTIEGTGSVNVPVVRKLKRPPEIWELVHTVPPGATPGRDFISRLPSSRSLFVLLVVLTLGVGGYLAVRGGKQIAGTRTVPAQAASKVDLRKAGVPVDKKSTQEPNVPNVPGPLVQDQTTAVVEPAVPKRKTSQRRSNATEAVTIVSNPSSIGKKVSSPEGSEVSLPSIQKTRPSANTTETTGTNSADAASSPKPKTSLSPQLIDTPKSDAPRKSKVIQWP